ncbi:TPA: conjugal transfer protein TraR [Escherichia coli]|nr:conjugal transfer protein TraR [Escherichia coli]HDX4877179.1 conjugal transfer protein TraR [Escherichia coli]
MKTQPATGETYPKSDLFNKAGIPVYLCEACGNPIPEARRKIFPGVTLCVECQAYQERQRKHYA